MCVSLSYHIEYCDYVYDQECCQHDAPIKCYLVKSDLSSYCVCVYDQECSQQHTLIKCSLVKTRQVIVL